MEGNSGAKSIITEKIVGDRQIVVMKLMPLEKILELDNVKVFELYEHITRYAILGRTQTEISVNWIGKTPQFYDDLLEATLIKLREASTDLLQMYAYDPNPPLGYHEDSVCMLARMELRRRHFESRSF